MGWNEHTSFGIFLAVDTCFLERPSNLVCDFRTTRCIMLDLVRLRREAVVIVQQLVFRAAGDGHFAGGPVRCNEHDGFGRVRRTQFEYLRHFFLQRLGNGGVRWVAEKGQRATAV